MKIAEFKKAAQASSRPNLEEAAIYVYRQLSRTEKNLIDEGLLNILEGKNEKIRKKNKLPDLEELNRSILEFTEAVKDGFYEVSDPLQSHAHAQWRYEVNRYYKSLLCFNPQDPGYDQASLLLKKLYITLSGACAFPNLPSADPFNSASISQRAFFSELCRHCLIPQADDQAILDILVLGAACGLDKRTRHTDLYPIIDDQFGDWSFRNRCIQLLDQLGAALPARTKINREESYENYMLYKETINIPLLKLYLMARDPYGLDTQILAGCMEQIRTRLEETGFNKQFDSLEETERIRAEQETMESELFILLRCLFKAERSDLYLRFYDQAVRELDLHPREELRQQYAFLMSKAGGLFQMDA